MPNTLRSILIHKTSELYSNIIYICSPQSFNFYSPTMTSKPLDHVLYHHTLNRPMPWTVLFDTNPYSVLCESETFLSDSQQLSDTGSPIHVSSPIKQNTAKHQMLRVLQLNFNSQKSSKYPSNVTTQTSYSGANPNSVTPTPHTPYAVEQNDRNRHGAGVMLALKAELDLIPKDHISTSIDNCYSPVQPQIGKKLLIGSLYHPPVTHLMSSNTSAERSPKCLPQSWPQTTS